MDITRPLLDEVIAIARDAGQIIQDMKDTARANPMTKADGSQVTQADQASEDFIVEKLQALAPGIPIVSEELVEAGNAPDLTGHDTFWSVDPLDGTTPFIRGDDFYTVNIGLVQNHRASLGVVYFPQRDLLLAGGGDLGAFMVQQGGDETALSVNTFKPVDQITVLVAGYTDQMREEERAQAEPHLTMYPNKSFESVSGTEKVMWLLEGRAEIYIRFMPCYEWDIAAPEAILRAGGGSLALLHGAPLQYGSSNFLVPPFLARADQVG